MANNAFPIEKDDVPVIYFARVDPRGYRKHKTHHFFFSIIKSRVSMSISSSVSLLTFDDPPSVAVEVAA